MFSFGQRAIIACGRGSDRMAATGGKLLASMEFPWDRLGQRPYHEHTGENICPSMVRGIDYLRDPRLNKELLDDDFYIGNRHERVTGQEYDDFIDEFMQAVVRRYGQNTLIQFEDFGNHNAFRFLDKYRGQYCTFNDDIQGTASVAVAGVLAALRETKTKLSDHRFLFQGAGEASIGIANLIVMAMADEGISESDARSKIYLRDSKGLIVKDRPSGGVTGHKVSFQKDLPPLESLEEIVKSVKPTVLIGAAAIGGVFTESILKDMASYNDRPIIFALSNPTSKAECTAEEAYKYTDGRAVFASGSPFDPVQVKGRTLYPGQGNNAYIFPGVSLGVICTGIHHIQDDLFLMAAKALADMVTDKDLSSGRLYPPLSDIRKCSLQIATYIAEHAYKTGIASTYPEPKDKRAFIEKQAYDFDYDKISAIPKTWDWPKVSRP
ncbi:Malic enzyme NAD-binding [Trinorchestia longiramus]|nr:Malic enzyme NAD-binding [Trinorchestia longiramus]